MSILMTEYDYATDIAIKQEEAYAIGIERGAHQKALETAKMFLSYGDDPEKVAICTQLPLDVVQELVQKQ